MTIHTVETKAAPAAIGPYSQAVAAGELLFVSGQLGMDPRSGELVGAGLADQARQALSNLLLSCKRAAAPWTMWLLWMCF